MIGDVQHRIVELHNELKAQKTFSGLAYSQLLMPDNTLQGFYSGTMSWDSSTPSPIARVRFRFTRTDGLIKPPLINFTHSSTYSPTYKEYAEANGFVFSPSIDMSYYDTECIEGYIGEIGDGYVDFYVDYKTTIRSRFYTLNSLAIVTSCQAIANVYGSLVVERII